MKGDRRYALRSIRLYATVGGARDEHQRAGGGGHAAALREGEGGRGQFHLNIALKAGFYVEAWARDKLFLPSSPESRGVGKSGGESCALQSFRK